LTRLAAVYSFGLVLDRPFVDGNKRTALMTAALFLAKNGFHLNAPQPEAVIATLRLSTGEWEDAPFAAWLQQNSIQI
jgi:death-on-curing protein